MAANVSQSGSRGSLPSAGSRGSLTHAQSQHFDFRGDAAPAIPEPRPVKKDAMVRELLEQDAPGFDLISHRKQGDFSAQPVKKGSTNKAFYQDRSAGNPITFEPQTDWASRPAAAPGANPFQKAEAGEPQRSHARSSAFHKSTSFTSDPGVNPLTGEAKPVAPAKKEQHGLRSAERDFNARSGSKEGFNVVSGMASDDHTHAKMPSRQDIAPAGPSGPGVPLDVPAGKRLLPQELLGKASAGALRRETQQNQGVNPISGAPMPYAQPNPLKEGGRSGSTGRMQRELADAQPGNQRPATNVKGKLIAEQRELGNQPMNLFTMEPLPDSGARRR